MIKHSQDCIRRMEQARRARARYDESWPRHCRTCEGWGITGSGYVDPENGMPDVDPCMDCADLGACPRCGATEHGFLGGLSEDGSECAACEWTFEKDGGKQPEPECFCEWESEIESIRRAWHSPEV